MVANGGVFTRRSSITNYSKINNPGSSKSIKDVFPIPRSAGGSEFIN